MRIGRNHANPGQAAGDEVGEEAVARRTGLASGNAHPEDLAVTITVDAGRKQDDGDGADAGIEAAVVVTVALGDPLRPYAAPATASASAERSSLTFVCNIVRI